MKITETGETVLEVTNFNALNASKSENYTFPVEGTMRHKIGWPGGSKKSCRWLSQQHSSKREEECSKDYIKGVCPNVCNTCNAIISPSCKWNESLLEVIVKTDDNPQQTSWVLSQNNVVIDSFSNYTQPNTIVNHQKCVKAGSCYEFTINDRGGDGIKNGGFVRVIEAGEIVLSYTEFISASENASIPVEGTMKHKIGWPGQNRLQCKWLTGQLLWKQEQECSRPYIMRVCPNACGTCI